MVAYAISPLMGVDITATSSLAAGSTTVYSPEYGLCHAVKTSDGEAIYVKAGAAITAGDVIQITMASGSATGITTLLTNADTTTAGQLIAVAHTTLASGQHGWACRAGVPTAGINVAASCAKGSPLYTTTTAGQVDDTSSSAHLIAGMELTATATGAAVTAGLCAYPQLISGTVNNT